LHDNTNVDEAVTMRVLLSEGSSTSAREAITVLGLNGHHIEICDPDPHCLGRFSRFVRKFHRCPALRDDPLGYLAFVETLTSRQRFDVLIPIHEQGYVFAAAPQRLHAQVRVALPSFRSYRTALRKSDFSRLATAIGLPQPTTRFVASARELLDVTLPCIVKAAIGTASRSTWLVRDRDELADVTRLLAARGDDDVLVQDYVVGAIERAQAVFDAGTLVAMHAYRQLRPGAGGGDAVKESIYRDDVRAHVTQLGEQLRWRGALSVDYICDEGGNRPLYIDCNPRLVEPMSAFLCGLDLLEALLRVSCNASPDLPQQSQSGVRTHLAMQALLGCALRGGTRRDLVRELRRLCARTGDYARSREELTPVRLDWPSAVPLVITALLLLVRPGLARRLPGRFGAHVLGARAAQLVEREVAS
jgi:hypothetical protein